VKDDKVYVQLSGGCQGCAGARMTLKAGVERVLREQIPEVKEVIDATDHGGGMDPFYSPGH
jgi:Fe/S biogenesis protein NfuA